MARNRLFVDEIVSVGLVAAGDNEPAEVVLFKSRDLDKKRREPTLSDYRAQIEEVRKERRHDQEVDKTEHRKRDNTNMPSTTPATDQLIAKIQRDRDRAQGEEVEPSLDELLKAKLDSWAGRKQTENMIAGKWGSMSTPRVDQKLKIKNLWWASPDGIAVKELLREQGSGDAEVILKSVEKSHSEAHAAIARLDA